MYNYNIIIGWKSVNAEPKLLNQMLNTEHTEINYNTKHYIISCQQSLYFYFLPHYNINISLHIHITYTGKYQRTRHADISGLMQSFDTRG